MSAGVVPVAKGPINPENPLAEHEASGVVVKKKPVASTAQPDNYKTEFVKVYQDAGVIGVAMLTLLALCVLLGIFSLRLLKMYIALTESRDKLEDKRVLFSEKLVERLISIDTTLKDNKGIVCSIRDEQHRVKERLSRMEVALKVPYRHEETSGGGVGK